MRKAGRGKCEIGQGCGLQETKTADQVGPGKDLIAEQKGGSERQCCNRGSDVPISSTRRAGNQDEAGKRKMNVATPSLWDHRHLSIESESMRPKGKDMSPEATDDRQSEDPGDAAAGGQSEAFDYAAGREAQAHKSAVRRDQSAAPATMTGGVQRGVPLRFLALARNRGRCQRCLRRGDTRVPDVARR